MHESFMLMALLPGTRPRFRQEHALHVMLSRTQA